MAGKHEELAKYCAEVNTMSVLKKFDLSGRTVLITGGAGLMGRQHAIAVTEAGARVILLDIREKELLLARDAVKNAVPHADCAVAIADITQRVELERIQERVDILINNAAVNPTMTHADELQETSRFENFSLSQWYQELSVGLTGAFLCSQVFGSRMALQRQGVILNIASDLAVIAPDQRIYRRNDRTEEQQPVKPVTYSVVKTGLLGLTKYLATYWAEQNVRVNAICPGGIYNDQSDDFVKRLTNLIPMGRMADAGEYKAAVLFLVSDASSYMTGTTVVVDGGRSTW